MACMLCLILSLLSDNEKLKLTVSNGISMTIHRDARPGGERAAAPLAFQFADGSNGAKMPFKYFSRCLCDNKNRYGTVN